MSPARVGRNVARRPERRDASHDGTPWSAHRRAWKRLTAAGSARRRCRERLPPVAELDRPLLTLHGSGDLGGERVGAVAPVADDLGEVVRAVLEAEAAVRAGREAELGGR